MKPPTPKEIIRRLDPLFGPVDVPRQLDPLGELVFTILSQSTADTNSQPAYEALVARFDGDWDRVRRARVSSIAAAIRRAGLANQKAPRIKALLARLHHELGSTTLDHLATMTDDEAVAYLTSFDGVGRKTAACVLMFACDRPVLPVDTHVHRISQRLKLIDAKVDATAAHDTLQAQLKPSEVFDFHVLLIRHGRSICRARRPRCRVCPLWNRCAAGQALVAEGLAADEDTAPSTPHRSATRQAAPHVPPEQPPRRNTARRKRTTRKG